MKYTKTWRILKHIIYGLTMTKNQPLKISIMYLAMQLCFEIPMGISQINNVYGL